MAKRLRPTATLLVLLAAHDPAIIKQASHSLFNTGGSFGIQRSTDLWNWSSVGTIVAV